MNGTRTTRLGVAGVGLIAALAVSAGTYVGVQHVNAQGPGSGPGGGRFGGPGGPGGPMGRRGGPMGPGGPGVLGPMMLGRLNLTEEQRGRVKQILDSHQDEQAALATRARAAHDALDAVVSGATFDEGAVRARAADVAVVDADMTVAQARIFAEVLQILTPDQQSQLAAMRAEMKAREGKMREQRREGRDKKH